ncbi:hypothetical protein EYC80_000746 [Monilinia laxa]|uniref:BTB domain-containing protein n=1 Tax=Monilinia laxa TaxID=61186 RepID=A0A5N6K731_MONLA|nr:hypothetical protein EYC80_000746 [Monilinia laxa]
MPPKRTRPNALPAGPVTEDSKRICSAMNRDPSTPEVQSPSDSELSEIVWTDSVTWYEGSETEDEQPSTVVSVEADSHAHMKSKFVAKKENSSEEGTKEPSLKIDVVKTWNVSFANSLGTRMCRFYIGKEDILFLVHKKVLCRKVPYFRPLLRQSHDVLHLEDDSPECFDLLLEWVYNDTLRPLVSRKQDETRQNYTTSWDPLALYAYARKLDLETLMNHTLDLIRHVDNAQKSFHGIQAIQKVFHPDAMLQVPSPLQVYVVQLAVHMMRIKEQGKYYTIETADFVTLLQLRGFAEQFVNANRWRDVRDPRAPFVHNKCSYHAHHDDKACEAQKYILNCDVERLEA